MNQHQLLSAFWQRIIVFLVCTLPCSGAIAQEIFVSPLGNDNYVGTRSQPLKTIDAAREKVRDLKAKDPKRDITVWLAGGQYQLAQTLTFDLKDGAADGHKIMYTALPGERPVVSSDVHLSGWKKVNGKLQGLPKKANGKIWMVPVPSSIKDFKTLYNNEHRLPRAKTKAFAYTRKYDNWVGTEEYHTSVPFPKDRVRDLFVPRNAELLLVPAAPWTMNILPVKSVDALTGMVQLGASSTYALAAPRFYMGPEAIWVENTFTGLDSNGKWVFDQDAHLLYYWPEDGKAPGENIALPALIELLRVEGTINYEGATDVPVNGLVFKGLTFTHGDRFESSGRTGLGLQHDWERFDASTALVRFRGAENCTVEDCIFINSGGAGIRLDLYAQHNKISNNEFSELGGAGILLAGYGPGTKDVNKYNEVTNNYIHHIGRLWWHASGIWAWQSGHNLIAHNTIHNVPYTAIAITGRIDWDKKGIGECSRTVRWHETGSYTGRESWEEREQFLHSRENIVSDNDIHHVMDIMQDGNGVYVSGTGRNNVVRGNFIHDTPSMAAGEAIRCDDDQNEVTIENNIVFRYGTHGIGICTKGRNYIFNNIVACPPDRVNRGMLSFEPINPKINAGSKVLHNIFYATRKDQPFVFKDGIYEVVSTVSVDRNIYFNSNDPKAGDDYLLWARANGIEAQSIQSDPLFMNIEEGDFRLKENSPAWSLGFMPFKMSAGRTVSK